MSVQKSYKGICNEWLPQRSMYMCALWKVSSALSLTVCRSPYTQPLVALEPHAGKHCHTETADDGTGRASCM